MISSSPFHLDLPSHLSHHEDLVSPGGKKIKGVSTWYRTTRAHGRGQNEEVSWCHTGGPVEPGDPGMLEEQVQVYAGAGQLSSSL